MVDKVFADWQKNPESESPKLNKTRKMAPFGYKEFNKFSLTNIPPDKTLDFESNLCYCYDCDLEQDFDEVKLPERTGEFNIKTGLPVFEAIEEYLWDIPGAPVNYYQQGESGSYSYEVNVNDNDNSVLTSSDSCKFDSLIRSKRENGSLKV